MELLNQEIRKMIEDRVSKSIENYGHGIELVEVKYFKEYGKLNVSILIWKEGGIDLNDCEGVHNFISPYFDEMEDLFDEDYILNVSSQGLDRPIVSDDDFRRALGTEIEVIINNKNKSHGILVSYDETSFVIDVTNTNNEKPGVKFDRNKSFKVQPYIRF